MNLSRAGRRALKEVRGWAAQAERVRERIAGGQVDIFHDEAREALEAQAHRCSLWGIHLSRKAYSVDGNEVHA